MSGGEVNPKGARFEFADSIFFIPADLTIRKRGEGVFEAEGKGTSLPDPLLFQKKMTPPPLRQSPGFAIKNGPFAIGLNSKNGFSTINYHYLNELTGERLKVEIEVRGGAIRHAHKREFRIDSGVAKIRVKNNGGNGREASKKISYSPTSLDKNLERLTEIRDSIQKKLSHVEYNSFVKGKNSG